MRVRRLENCVARVYWLFGSAAVVCGTAILPGCGGSSEPVASNSAPVPPPAEASPASSGGGSTAPSGAPSSAGHGDSGSTGDTGSSGESSSPPSSSPGGGFGGGEVAFDSGGGSAPAGGGHGAGQGGGPPASPAAVSPGGAGHGGGGAGGGGSPYGEGYDTGYGGNTTGGMTTPGMPTPGGLGGNSTGSPGGLPTGNLDIGDMFGALAQVKPDSLERFPKDYKTQAELAFQQGYEKLAYDLYLAHLATEAKEAGEAYDAVQLSKLLRRPAWHLRWGLAITVRTPEGYSGGLEPITNQTASSGGGGMSSGPPGAFDASSGPGVGMPGLPPGVPGGLGSSSGGGSGAPLEGGTAIADIDRALGLFAEVTGEMFDRRFTNGGFGNAFSRFGKKPAANSNQNPNGQGGGMAAMGPGGMAATGPGGMPMMGPGGMAAAGPGGPPIPAGYPGMTGMNPPSTPGMPEGYPGMMGPGGMAGPGGAQGGNQQQSVAALVNRLPVDYPQWRPGIVYLGQVDFKEVASAAQRAGVDFVLHFDVSVERRRESVENETRLRVLNLTSSDKPQLAASKRLTSTDVKNRGRSGSVAKEIVASAVKPVFDAIDRDVVLMEMPSLTAEQAKKRIGDLLNDNSGNEMRHLAEVQLYRHRGLIDDQQVMNLAEMFIGNEAIRLFAGSPGVQREAANSLQKHLTAYGEIGMADPNAMAARGNNNNGAMGFGGGGFGGGAAGFGNPGGGNNPSAPSLDPGGAGHAAQGPGGGVSPPALDL